MRALFRPLRQDPAVSINQAMSEVCDTACRANAALDRFRATAVLFR